MLIQTSITIAYRSLYPKDVYIAIQIDRQTNSYTSLLVFVPHMSIYTAYRFNNNDDCGKFNYNIFSK